MKLLLIATILLFVASTQAQSTDDLDWDYILYVTRWAGTVGYGDSLPENVTGFTLHGMWPTRNDGSYPSYCSNDPFNPSSVKSIIPELDVAWYDYESSNYSLWTHEWEKHGTCAAKLSALDSEYNFFNFGVTMYNKYDILDTLTSAGYTPSESAMYETSDVSNALANAFGQTPILTCENSGAGYSLWRVEFCLGQSLQLQACPSNAGGSDLCSGSFYIPPITH